MLFSFLPEILTQVRKGNPPLLLKAGLAAILAKSAWQKSVKMNSNPSQPQKWREQFLYWKSLFTIFICGVYNLLLFL